MSARTLLAVCLLAIVFDAHAAVRREAPLSRPPAVRSGGDDGFRLRSDTRLAALDHATGRGSPHADKAFACPPFADGFEPFVSGDLEQTAPGAPIDYVTSGGYAIRIDGHTITVRDPIDFNRVEHWGDPHENLNGKHIKDWEGTRRSLLLDDGTKITWEAAGAQGVVEHTSIYDGHRNVQIDNAANEIVHESAELADTLCRDHAQYDGETARFGTDVDTGVATYSQAYLEDENFEITADSRPLGTTGGFANPGQIRDFYDDPRLGHT